MEPRLRIGIVGAGFIAGVIAQAIRESTSCALSAVASRTLASAERLAAEFDVANVYPTWQALLESGSVDAVYVATPTVAEEEICLAAAAAKLHVLADKPFTDAASVRRIGDACLANGVAFLDATHFVHHPRHRLLKETFVERIGAARNIHTSFFFPISDRSNIRVRPDQEPTGAVGDMAWYSMRAVVEFTPDDAVLTDAKGFVVRDPITNGVIRTSGVLRLSDGTLSVWEAGYDTGSAVQSLALQGERGMISQDDFVLDWAGGFNNPDPSHRVGFVERHGAVPPRDWTTVETPSSQRQSVCMMEHFAALCRADDPSAVRQSIRTSERTQELVDAIWAASVD
jgi:predicted dehydrogenase